MSRHVTIIGAGIIGLATAYYSLQRGLSVRIVEKQGADRDGCSYGNTGMIVPSHFIPLAAPGMIGVGFKSMWNSESPFYIKPTLSPELIKWGVRFARSCTKAHVNRAAPLLCNLHLASRTCYEELSDELDDVFSMARNGLLMMCETQKTLDEEAKLAERGQEMGIVSEVLNGQQTNRVDPGMTSDVCGSVYFKQDCHLVPELLMDALQKRVEELGAEMVWDTEAFGFESRGSQIDRLVTSNGNIDVQEVVLAGGSWTGSLCRELGLKLPMQAGKGYSMTLEQPRELPTICAILTEAKVAVSPMNGSLRFGGTMELSGIDESVSESRVRGIAKSIPRYFPNFRPEDFASSKPWVGLRPCSPDGLPYVGRTRRVDNVVIASGHAMMGNSLAPITGKLVAEVILGDRPEYDIELLSPDRFS